MHDTDFHVPEAKLRAFADCYVRSAAGTLAPAQLGEFVAPPRAPSGGGGLVGTAADYLRFCEMLRRGGELGGVRLVGPKTLALHARPTTCPAARTSPTSPRPACSRRRPTRDGLRPRLRDGDRPGPLRRHRVAGEFSWGGMASTAFWVDPVEDVCVVFMTQLMPSSTYPCGASSGRW
jgi:CubicO group peptidase (beta-lactamase class C family)